MEMLFRHHESTNRGCRLQALAAVLISTCQSLAFLKSAWIFAALYTSSSSNVAGFDVVMYAVEYYPFIYSKILLFNLDLLA